MRAPEAITAEGIVHDQIKADVYRVKLANGHEAVAHLSKALKKTDIKFLPQQKILLAFSTHDLSRACILQAISLDKDTQAPTTPNAE